MGVQGNFNTNNPLARMLRQLPPGQKSSASLISTAVIWSSPPSHHLWIPFTRHQASPPLPSDTPETTAHVRFQHVHGCTSPMFQQGYWSALPPPIGNCQHHHYHHHHYHHHQPTHTTLPHSFSMFLDANEEGSTLLVRFQHSCILGRERGGVEPSSLVFEVFGHE